MPAFLNFSFNMPRPSWITLLQSFLQMSVFWFFCFHFLCYSFRALIVPAWPFNTSSQFVELVLFEFHLHIFPSALQFGEFVLDCTHIHPFIHWPCSLLLSMSKPSSSLIIGFLAFRISGFHVFFLFVIFVCLLTPIILCNVFWSYPFLTLCPLW